MYNEAGTPAQPFNLIDRDNLVVEDLFVYARTGTTTAGINYYIEFDKYDISEGLGALTMVRNSSQSVWSMNDDVEKTLADPKHPIWKVMLGLVAVLSALWMNSTV